MEHTKEEKEYTKEVPFCSSQSHDDQNSNSNTSNFSFEKW